MWENVRAAGLLAGYVLYDEVITSICSVKPHSIAFVSYNVRTDSGFPGWPSSYGTKRVVLTSVSNVWVKIRLGAVQHDEIFFCFRVVPRDHVQQQQELILNAPLPHYHSSLVWTR